MFTEIKHSDTNHTSQQQNTEQTHTRVKNNFILQNYLH